jgi:hypothetical protein
LSKAAKRPASSSTREGFDQDLSLPEEINNGPLRRYNIHVLQLAIRARTVTTSRKDQRVKTKPTLTIEIVSDIV